MTTAAPWTGPVPTLEQAAQYLPRDAAFLTGSRETMSPPTVTHLGTWHASEGGPAAQSAWTMEAALVEYGYMSHYRGHEVTKSTTLFQLARSGFAPDGWARFEVYAAPGALSHERAGQVASLIVEGLLPSLVDSGEL